VVVALNQFLKLIILYTMVQWCY